MFIGTCIIYLFLIEVSAWKFQWHHGVCKKLHLLISSPPFFLLMFSHKLNIESKCSYPHLENLWVLESLFLYLSHLIYCRNLLYVNAWIFKFLILEGSNFLQLAISWSLARKTQDLLLVFQIHSFDFLWELILWCGLQRGPLILGLQVELDCPKSIVPGQPIRHLSFVWMMILRELILWIFDRFGGLTRPISWYMLCHVIDGRSKVIY